LLLLQCEKSVIKNGAEGVIEELANWHFLVRVLSLKQLKHALKHALWLAVLVSLHEFLVQLLMLEFLVGVELDFMAEFLVRVSRGGLVLITRALAFFCSLGEGGLEDD